jgi:LPS-assembly protein
LHGVGALEAAVSILERLGATQKWAIRMIVLFACATAAAAAVAQETGGPESATPPDEPALITADELVYDETLGIVTARGNVEVSQGSRLLRADTVTYDRRTEIVAASGNVVLLEEDGTYFFADYVELSDDLKDGLVERIGVLLADNSRIAGNSGLRQLGQRTEIDRAVYSPCALCADDPRRPPLWQIRAVRVTHDTATQDVVYHDAFFDFFGIPVIYLPYFSHPDPSVKQRSGLLAPSIGSTANLGPFLGLQYYFGIAPNQDATLGVTFTRDSGVKLGGQYRYQFDRGFVQFDGSVNRSSRRTDRNGQEVLLPADWRWHLFGTARYDIDEHWRAGVDIARTSDSTYLKAFDISDDDVLTNRAFAEGFYGLSYATVEAYDFQDLRDPPGDSPAIVPWAQGSYVSEPGIAWGGQWFANGSVINLYRDEAPTRSDPTAGVDTRRLSTQVGWQREIYTDIGVVVTARASARADFYWSDNVPGLEKTPLTEDDVTAARVYPVGTIIARYPLVGTIGESFQQLVEPVVAFTAAPNYGDQDTIPNNDSIDVEFDEINLFGDNRFPGLDRVESGQRVTYGLRYGLYGPDGTSSSAFLGQSFRFQEDDTFSTSSGLRDELSDIVGRVTVHPAPFLDLDWRFRLDADNLYSRNQNLLLSAGPDWLKLNGVYSLIDNQDDQEVLVEDQEQIRLGVVTQVDDFWTVGGGAIYDLRSAEPVSYRAGLRYADECFIISAAVERDFNDDPDLRDGFSFYLSIGLKNLGYDPSLPLTEDSDITRSPFDVGGAPRY